MTGEHARWRPAAGDWTAQELTEQVRVLRDILELLGVPLSRCLPGEPQDCDVPLIEHYVTYLGHIRARTLVLASLNLRGAQRQDYTETVREWTDVYLAEGREGSVAV